MLSTSHFRSLAVALAICLLQACGRKGEEGLESRGASGGESGPIFGALQSVYASQDFVRRCAFEYGDNQELTLEDSYAGPTGWTTYTHTYSTSYAIRRVASVSKNRFYILGAFNNGDDVIEKWQIKAVMAIPPNPGAAPVIARSELFRSPALGPVREIGIDPDGRFLLIVHGSPVVLSKMALPGLSITSVYSSTNLPFLASVDTMTPMQHLSEGRLWILESSTIPDFMILRDANNDGLFESTSFLTYQAWNANYTGAVWANDFTHDF